MSADGHETTRDYDAFLERYPAYRETAAIDELRRTEFSRLDEQGHVYLDYTGGGLYGSSQVRGQSEFLLRSVLGNPHSINPSSSLATEGVESCRRRLLEFFNASPEEYVPVFTANATHALKLVGEGYPFCVGDVFLLTFDNHNSVNGIREFDRAHGSLTRYVPLVPPDMRVEAETLDRYLDEGAGVCNRLFAFPAQSNFSGVQHPLEWIGKARERGWDVLLDAAAFVPTNRLDLSRWKPDYVTVSFYKMFGHPTGVGALVARREALEKLHRPWFAGGTITVASVTADKYALHPGAEGFEDGTINYTGLPAVEMGLDFLDRVGMETIHARVMALTGWLLDGLLALRHGNGMPVVRLYGPASTEGRGGTVTINVVDRQGVVVDHTIVERAATRRLISLRTGCFCNPGAGELALGLTRDDIERCFNQPESRMSYDEFRLCVDPKSAGAVRISVGIASNFPDVQAVLALMEEFRQP